MTHTYNDHPCIDCGDMEGCYIPGKVKRRKELAKFGQAYPKVICLCGSTRFKEAYEAAMRAETMEGNIVLSVGLFGHLEGLDMNGPFKQMLDELHLRKIDEADEVLIINCTLPSCSKCGMWHNVNLAVPTESVCCRVELVHVPYIGTSTQREIAYAKSIGKKIRYLEEMKG